MLKYNLFLKVRVIVAYLWGLWGQCQRELQVPVKRGEFVLFCLQGHEFSFRKWWERGETRLDRFLLCLHLDNVQKQPSYLVMFWNTVTLHSTKESSEIKKILRDL